MVPGFYDWYIRGWRVVGGWVTGTNVFDEEWDVLVLLDCARLDMIAEVSDEYPYVASGETLQSVASCSFEWLRKTFGGHHSNQLAETAYITANPNTDAVDGVDLLADLIEAVYTLDAGRVITHVSRTNGNTTSSEDARFEGPSVSTRSPSEVSRGLSKKLISRIVSNAS